MAAQIKHDGSRVRGTGRKLFWTVVLAGGALALFHLNGCGRHSGSHGWHARGGHATVLTEEEARNKLDKAADRFLLKAGVTPEQRAAVSGILDDLAKDWVAFQGERKEIAGEFAETVSADRIDPNRAGMIRKKSEELASRAVGRVMEAAFRIADTMEPEQRRKIVNEWKERM
jgi:Spy/CpxP family protein refolding chaperone